jgi:hypothetical protein
MVSGGARARSGPSFDPNSERSERLGRSLFSLSAAGYKHRPKRFPLSTYFVFDIWKDDDGFHKEKNESLTDRWNNRETELWRELWKLPQAIAWHMPEFAYLQNTVALYVRQFVICESPDAKAADRSTLQRYADTIGLTPQGLRLNGWAIVDDSERRVNKRASDSKIVRLPSARERIKRG